MRAGRAGIGTLLELTRTLEAESDPDVLQAVRRVTGDLMRRLAPDAGLGPIRSMD